MLHSYILGAQQCCTPNGLRLFRIVLLFASAGVVIPKPCKTTRLYHLIAATATIVWRRTGWHNWCREDRVTAAGILTAVAITCTLVPIAAIAPETPQ